MLILTFVLIFGLVSAARRNNVESTGYDSNNWPASLVIDTAHLSDSSAQHDLFYGGGGSASSTQRSFEHKERPTTVQVDQRINTTQSTRNNTTHQPTTTPTSRPEFTPNNQKTTAFNEDDEDHTTKSQAFPIPSELGERRTVHEKVHENPTTISSQFDAYNQVNEGRPRQNWYPAESIDSRHFGQSTSRLNQQTRRPSSASNEYDGPRFQASSDNQQQFRKNDEGRSTTPKFQSNARSNGQSNEYEQVEFAASQDRTDRIGSNQRIHENRRTNSPVNDPTVRVSQDSRQGLMISPAPNNDDGINRDFSVDNRNNRRPIQSNEYESQATFSSAHDSNQRQEVVDNEKARLVAKLLNIDRISSYTLDADDASPEAVDKVENSTIIQRPSSPFSNATSAEIQGINEILTRPLNASDQPFEDKNLKQATLEIIKLLHDEPTGHQKETIKVGKKIRVIRLPPMSSEDESEEIVLVGERGNATVHRGRNTMFIHATSNAQKRRV